MLPRKRPRSFCLLRALQCLLQIARSSVLVRSVLAQLLEPPYTDPYVRWCGRGGAERLPPIPILIFRPPLFRPGGVLMRPDDGGIEHQIFEVRIIGHRLEDPSPNTLDAPSTEAPEHAVPIPERLRKITPGGARTHNPQHAFHEHPVVAAGRTLLVRSTDNQWRHPLPRRIAQNQTVLHTQDCLPKSSLESDLLLKGNP